MSGTAWRCMLEPMSARLASSFSRNGISDAATDTSWFGDTSISVDLVRLGHARSRRCGGPRRWSSMNLPFLSMRGVGLGDVVPLFLRAPSRTRPRRSRGPPRPCGTGVSMKPNSLTRA